VQAFSQAVVLAASDPGQPGEAGMLAALAPRFSVQRTARSRTVRRTWLDTFDWRLHRAGFTLEYVTGRRPAELVLTGPAGDVVTQQASRLSWPARAGDLPTGPVRDRLCATAGIRALLPAARAASTVRQLRVLNEDAKTIAWLTVDNTAVRWPAAAQLPARLQVSAVRGYQPQADRVTQLLAAAAGQNGAAGGPLDAALAAAGRHAEDYSNKLTIRLSPDMPGRLALRTILLDLLDSIQANVPGTLRDIDTEFLHDLRVAVRRTRSALKLAGDVLPAGLAARFAPEFKWLGDLTTPTRDLDVYLLGYQDMADGLVSAKPAELAPFHDHLVGQRGAEYRRLVRGLRSARFARLISDWRAALTSLGPATGGPRAMDLATARLRRAHRKVLRQGQAITPDSPAERLHDLRKRCKELRYLLEFFASLFEPQAHQRTVKDLKGLQDCLGEFQDRQVQQQELREFAGQMIADPDTPATALLAMGELAGQLGLRQQQARREFAGRFRDFASPASERRFDELTGRASL
jgi:CHAD domain-containing protein